MDVVLPCITLHYGLIPIIFIMKDTNRMGLSKYNFERFGFMTTKKIEALTLIYSGKSKTFVRKKLNIKARKLNHWIACDKRTDKEKAILMFFLRYPKKVICENLMVTRSLLNDWIDDSVSEFRQHNIVQKKFVFCLDEDGRSLKMPNKVTNKIIFTGDKNEVARAINYLKSDTEAIDFNRITPMPDWVINEELDRHIEAKYGRENCWYKWSLKNWGTKWNAYNTSCEGNKIIFYTAWSAPIDLIKKLSMIFKEIEIELSWADEEIGQNTGRITFIDGHIAREDSIIFGSKEAYDNYVYVTGIPVEEAARQSVTSNAS